MKNNTTPTLPETYQSKVDFLASIRGEILEKNPEAFGPLPFEKSVEDFDSAARAKYQTVFGMGTI